MNIKTVSMSAVAILSTLSLCLGSSQALPQAPLGSPPFLSQSTATVVKFMGWETEEHLVPSNGYYISLTRMINPLATNRSAVRRAVVFSHGIFQDSISEFLSFAEYVQPEAPTSDSYSTNVYSDVTSDELGLLGEATEATYKRLCLPCVFSNNNYDVWIGEQRGSLRESQMFYDPELKNSQQYWNFTSDNQALEDVPNVIDYILNVTQLKKLTYVGYSKGTLHMHMLLSTRPEYGDKLAAYVGLAPIAYLGTIRGGMRLLIPLEPVFRELNAPYLSYENLIKLNLFLSASCKVPLARTTLCRGLYEILGGPDFQTNVLTEVFYGHAFEPNSLKVLAQVAQFMQTNEFKRFDYGSEQENMAAYGVAEPPRYSVEDIRFKKMILVRSTGNDWLSTREDHEQFIATLKVPLFRDILTPLVYNHFSFYLAKDAFTKVFKPVIQTVNQAYLTED